MLAFSGFEIQDLELAVSFERAGHVDQLRFLVVLESDLVAIEAGIGVKDAGISLHNFVGVGDASDHCAAGKRVGYFFSDGEGRGIERYALHDAAIREGDLDRFTRELYKLSQEYWLVLRLASGTTHRSKLAGFQKIKRSWVPQRGLFRAQMRPQAGRHVCETPLVIHSKVMKNEKQRGPGGGGALLIYLKNASAGA